MRIPGARVGFVFCATKFKRDGANERAGSVILAAVASGIAHVLDLGFVEVREFVLIPIGRGRGGIPY